MAVELLHRTPRAATTAPDPGHVPDPATLTGVTGAWHRAMPYTRLVDCGMDPADARELLCATAAGAPWAQVATTIGDRQLDRAQLATHRGRPVTARAAARAAVAALNFAQMAHNTDTDAKRSAYDHYLQAMALVVALSDGAIEEVTLRYRHGQLTGWLCLPSAGRAQATVIVWGGLSGWGATYLPIAEALTQRGMACLLAEGPGQGRPRLHHRLHLRPDTLEGFARFLDHVAADPRLEGGIGIQGNSFGGLFAAHLATTDERVAACVINGAPATPTVPEFRSAREQILAVLGTEDVTEATGLLEGLQFDPHQHSIDIPCLILQGGADPLATPEAQAPFAQAARHPQSQLLTWPEGEHTLYNHATERNAVTADWFHDQLTTTPATEPAHRQAADA
jgi:alpha-beta hydrolase superfamily lysophospholipase